ncbi:uncharacterized protein LOC108939771 [Scleropages formosus]|uniref:uncharacterized protein LOC108939771 n=1 Tax=Scleropages formosus TaxID=113540 RepID=UPI000878301C|nr:uncharacterized protein LOC108939771 [Scleropages formosus]
MSYSSRQLVSLPLLLLLLSYGRGSHQQEQITRVAGEDIIFNISITESDEDIKGIKTVSLYKDTTKVGECLHMAMNCTYSRGVLKTISQQVIVSIQNLSVNDSGNYSVTFFLQPTKPQYLIHAGPVCLSVISGAASPFTNSPDLNGNNGDAHNDPSTSFSYIYIIFALALSTMMLPAVLLSWFCWTPKRSSDRGLSPSPTNEYQVRSEVSRTVPMHSTEYGVLEFPNMPERKDKAERSKEPIDSVEYATITFSLVNTSGTMLGQKSVLSKCSHTGQLAMPY